MAGKSAEGRALVCHWWDDGRGGRYLIPGCHARVENPDLEVCHCPTVEQQLEAVRRQVAGAGRPLRGLQSWHDAIVRAIYDHPDGIAIMKAAADLAECAQGGGGAVGSRWDPGWDVDEPPVLELDDFVFDFTDDNRRRRPVEHWTDLLFQMKGDPTQVLEAAMLTQTSASWWIDNRDGEIAAAVALAAADVARTELVEAAGARRPRSACRRSAGDRTARDGPVLSAFHGPRGRVFVWLATGEPVECRHVRARPHREPHRGGAGSDPQGAPAG